MKKLLVILLLPIVCYSGPLTINNVPIVFTPTSLSNGPMSVVNGTNVNNQGALKGYTLTATNDLNFGATLNGIASNILQRISGLTSDAQVQITANGTAITLLNTSVTGLTNGLLSVSNSLGVAIINLNSISNGLITTSNRVETVNTAKQDVFTTGLGLTNRANVLSNNIVAGANVTITAGANGQLTITSTGSGAGDNWTAVGTTNSSLTGIATVNGIIATNNITIVSTNAGGFQMGDGGTHFFGFTVPVLTTSITLVPPTAPFTGIPKYTIGAVTNDIISQAVAETDYVTPTGTGTLSGKSLARSATIGTDDTFQGNTIVGLNNTGGVTQWDTVYLNSSSQWALADANGSGTYPCRGLAISTVSTGGATTIINNGTIRNDGWAWTPGGTLYLSTTAGGLTQTAPSTTGDKVQVIGFALTATIISVNISSDYGTAP